jgi:hypothetical protein
LVTREDCGVAKVKPPAKRPARSVLSWRAAAARIAKNDFGRSNKQRRSIDLGGLAEIKESLRAPGLSVF